MTSSSNTHSCSSTRLPGRGSIGHKGTAANAMATLGEPDRALMKRMPDIQTI